MIDKKIKTTQSQVLLTVILIRKLSRFFLNNSMMCLRVALRPGILTPFVARAATSIIFLKDGWSRAWIGCVFVLDLADWRGARETYLICRDKPFDRSLSKKGIGVGDKCFSGGSFLEVWIEQWLLWMIVSLLGSFLCLDCLRKLWLKIVLSTPGIILGLWM